MRFTEAMQTVTRHGDHWQATVSEDWLQGRSAFGGLQAALALRAMREQVPADMPLRSLQVTFIAPVPAGSVTIQAQRLREGRSAIQVEASLCDGAQTLCRLVGVFGSARPSLLNIQPMQPPRGKHDSTRGAVRRGPHARLHPALPPALAARRPAIQRRPPA